jgi:hypothetical protein
MPTFEKFNYFEVALDKIKNEIKKPCIVIIPKKNQTVFSLGSLYNMDVRIKNEINASGFALITMPDQPTALDLFNRIIKEYNAEFPAFIVTNETGEPVLWIPVEAMAQAQQKKKFLAVIVGVGEGCDYTIGCNQTTTIVETADATVAFNKILEEYGETEFRNWENPDDFDDHDFRIETITLYDITASIPIAMNVFNILNQEYQLYKNKIKENPEYQEYLRLKQKFK